MRRLLSLAAAVALIGALALPTSVGAFSANGQCGGLKTSMATIDLGSGYWTPGVHTYSIRYVDTNPLFPYTYDATFGPFSFTVSDTAPVIAGNVMLPNQDYWNGSIWSAGFTPVLGNTINPAQGTFFWAGWEYDMVGGILYSPPDTVQSAKADLAQASIFVKWDNGPWVQLNQGPLTSMCANASGGVLMGGGFFHRTWGKKV